VELTRHDKPVAVIISWEEYQKQKPKKTFLQRLAEIRAEYADVLADPTFEGLPLSPKEYLDDEYNKKIDAMWGE
jgi:antitoxin Phd